MTNFMDYIRNTFTLTPWDANWQLGVEGTDYFNFTPIMNNAAEQMEELFQFLWENLVWPGTKYSIAIPAGAILLIPYYWKFGGIKLSIFDIIFGIWLCKMMPTSKSFSVSILGFGGTVPIPLALVVYFIVKDINVPVFGDGSITALTALHPGTPTYFSGQTDGKFTFKDVTLDAFLVWFCYFVGKHWGPEVVAILIRVILWGISKLQPNIKHVLDRVRDTSVTLTNSTGYGIQPGEKTNWQKLVDTFNEIDINQFEGDQKDIILKIRELASQPPASF